MKRAGNEPRSPRISAYEHSLTCNREIREIICIGSGEWTDFYSSDCDNHALTEL